MGSATMGKTLVRAKIENLEDLYLVKQGKLKPKKVRSIEVIDALVDSGATTLSLPTRLLDQLGLEPVGRGRMRTAGGVRNMPIYEAARLTVQGRYCITDVHGLPDDCPVLIGQVPLELMDFVIDPKGQKLIGNPEHGGRWMLDLF
jgi:predicted aspartyl protease